MAQADKPWQDDPDRFGHHALVNLLLVILWAQPGDTPGFQINDDLLSGLFALAGTAIYSVLWEYEIGQYVGLEFSQKNVGNNSIAFYTLWTVFGAMTLRTTRYYVDI